MLRAQALSQTLTSDNVNLTPGPFRTWWGSTVWTQFSAHVERRATEACGSRKRNMAGSGKGDWEVMEFECLFMGTAWCVRGHVRRVRATDLQSLGEEVEK